jgi:beta-glucanase (GH16 family)
MRTISLFLQAIIISLYANHHAFALQHDKTGSTDEKYVTTVFFEDFNGPIDKKVWTVGGWTEHGGKLSPDRCYVRDSLLNMVFINDPVEGYLGAAIQTLDEFLYGRWEARLKPSDVPGVLNSFYTIDWDNTEDASASNDGTKQEVDIEFLTKSFNGTTGEVHFAVHASGRKSFNLNPDIKLDFDPSGDFHVWGFDITPEYIEWFVDDKVLYKYVYSKNDITINAPYMLKLNVWSSENWVGGPPEANIECVYQIDWIKFTPMGYTSTNSIEEKDKKPDVKIVPNPNNGFFKTEISWIADKALSIEIMNVHEQVVAEKNVSSSNGLILQEFNLENLAKGAYYIKVSDKENRITKKLIVN